MPDNVRLIAYCMLVMSCSLFPILICNVNNTSAVLIKLRFSRVCGSIKSQCVCIHDRLARWPTVCYKKEHLTCMEKTAAASSTYMSCNRKYRELEARDHYATQYSGQYQSIRFYGRTTLCLLCTLPSPSSINSSPSNIVGHVRRTTGSDGVSRAS